MVVVSVGATMPDAGWDEFDAFDAFIVFWVGCVFLDSLNIFGFEM